MKLLKVIVISMCIIMLSGCIASKSIKNVEYVSLEGKNVIFKTEEGKVMKFIGNENDVRLLVPSQKYAVEYAFDSIYYKNYAIVKISLNEDSK